MNGVHRSPVDVFDLYAKANSLKAELDATEDALARVLRSRGVDAGQLRLALERCWQRRTELRAVEQQLAIKRNAEHQAQRIPGESGRRAHEERVAWRRGRGPRPLVRGAHAAST